MQDEDEDLLEIAKYIKKELCTYFLNNPRMMNALRKIQIENMSDRVRITIPDEIYNVLHMKDRFIARKCIENGIKKYLNDNDLIGSVY